MSVQIEDFTATILNQAQQRGSVFLRLACDAIDAEANPKTPKKAGFLRRGVIKTVTGLRGKLEWRTDYAEYQERGSRKDGSNKVKNYTTPGTGPHYAENAVKKIVGDASRIMKMANLI